MGLLWSLFSWNGPPSENLNALHRFLVVHRECFFLQNTYQNHSAMTVLFPAVWSGRGLCKIIPGKRDGYEPIPSPVLEELSRSLCTTSSFLQYWFKFLMVLRQEVGGQHQGKTVVLEIHNAHTLCRGCEALAYLLCCGASRTLAARLAFSCPPPWLAVVFRGTRKWRNEVDVFLWQLLHFFYWFIHYFLIFVLLW